MTSSEPRDDRKNRLAVSTVPVFDVTKMFTSMFELGAGMLRTQQQMFASLVRATRSNRNTGDTGDTGDSDRPAPPGAGQPDASGSDVDQRVWAERESGIALRAEEISHSPEAGSDFDNWIRAESERTIAARAEKISRCRPVGGDVENWLQAEREIHAQRELIAARAREVAASPLARGESDNWLQAERELRAAGRI